MNLQECKFTHAGTDYRFTVSADGPVKTVLDSVIDMPLMGQAEVYRVEPTAPTKFVSVLEHNGKKECVRFWLLKDSTNYEEVVNPIMIAEIEKQLDWRH